MTAPCHWCVSLATVPQARHPLLQEAAGRPCPVPTLALAFFLLPQSYVTGLTLGDRNSHLVIPGTLWHMDRGADTGREEAGRMGNWSLLTASSWAAWRGSRCCRCHAGSSGRVTARRRPRRVVRTLNLPEGCLGRPPVAYSVAICSMWSLSSLYCSSSRLPITACFFRKSLHSFLFRPNASML